MAVQVVGKDVNRMFGSIAKRYDLANSVLSMGIHHLWRRKLIKGLPQKPDGFAVDLCTGTADLIPSLAARYSEVAGLDFCLPMLLPGKKKLKERSVASTLLQGDVLNLPFAAESVDVMTVAFGVRNLEDLSAGLSEIRRVLNEGGSLHVLEFGQPSGLWGAVFRFYSRFVMPFVGGILTGNRDAYEYLPETSAAFPCKEDFVSILKSCGYSQVSYSSLTGGVAYIYRAVK